MKKDIEDIRCYYAKDFAKFLDSQEPEQKPKECKHKDSFLLLCNQMSCEGVEFVHNYHCEDCGKAILDDQEIGKLTENSTTEESSVVQT